MIISIVITILLLYIAFNSKVNGDRLPKWTYYVIALLTLASWESTLVMLGLCAYGLYIGVKQGDVSTIKGIEKLIK